MKRFTRLQLLTLILLIIGSFSSYGQDATPDQWQDGGANINTTPGFDGAVNIKTTTPHKLGLKVDGGRAWIHNNDNGQDSPVLELGIHKDWNAPNFQVFSGDGGGHNYMTTHGGRWGSHFRWTRSSNDGRQFMASIGGDDNQGQYFNLFGTAPDSANVVKVRFNSNPNAFSYINTNGKFGLGTDAPQYKLHALGDIYAENGWFRTSGQHGLYSDSYNSFLLPINGNYWGLGSDRGLILFNKAGNLRGGLYHNNANGFGLLDGDGSWGIRLERDRYTSFLIDNKEKMRILDNGNVGIGTPAPTAKLDVDGQARIRNLPVGGTEMVTVDVNGNLRKQAIPVPVILPGTGDNLGNHCATMDLNMKCYDIDSVQTIQVRNIQAKDSLNIRAFDDINVFSDINMHCNDIDSVENLQVRTIEGKDGLDIIAFDDINIYTDINMNCFDIDSVENLQVNNIKSKDSLINIYSDINMHCNDIDSVENLQVRTIEGKDGLDITAVDDINIDSGDFLHLKAANGITLDAEKNSTFGIGIGMMPEADCYLSVNGTTKVKDNLKVEKNALIDNRVGINTPAPTHELDVNGQARVRVLPVYEFPIVTVDHEGVLHKSEFTPLNLLEHIPDHDHPHDHDEADNLGNHCAEQNLDMKCFDIENIKNIKGKDSLINIYSDVNMSCNDIDSVENLQVRNIKGKDDLINICSDVNMKGFNVENAREIHATNEIYVGIPGLSSVTTIKQSSIEINQIAPTDNSNILRLMTGENTNDINSKGKPLVLNGVDKQNVGVGGIPGGDVSLDVHKNEYGAPIRVRDLPVNDSLPFVLVDATGVLYQSACTKEVLKEELREELEYLFFPHDHPEYDHDHHGEGDNLGDHCATMNLNMKGFSINNAENINVNKNIVAGQDISAGRNILADQDIVATRDIKAGRNVLANNSVGINTPAPTHALDVNGQARIRNLPPYELPIVTVDTEGVLHQSSISTADLLERLEQDYPPGGVYHGEGDNLGNHQADQWLNMNNNKINNLDDPIELLDAVNKAYVDNLFGALSTSTDVVKKQQGEIEDLRKELTELKEVVNTLLKAQKTTTNHQKHQLNANQAYLEQNQPNPFNTNTLIRYNIPQNTGSATIHIHDATGKKVHTERISQKGKGELQLQAATIPPGAYTYVLLIDEQIVDSKKMIISK